VACCVLGQGTYIESLLEMTPEQTFGQVTTYLKTIID